MKEATNSNNNRRWQVYDGREGGCKKAPGNMGWRTRGWRNLSSRNLPIFWKEQTLLWPWSAHSRLRTGMVHHITEDTPAPGCSRGWRWWFWSSSSAYPGMQARTYRKESLNWPFPIDAAFCRSNWPRTWGGTQGNIHRILGLESRTSPAQKRPLYTAPCSTSGTHVSWALSVSEAANI